MDRLRFLRKSLNLTQKYMSDILGITQGAYSAIELGRNELTDRNAEILSNKLGINKTWLLTGLGDIKAGQEDSNIDALISEATQELLNEGKSIGGSVPYEFVQQLFEERKKHDDFIIEQQIIIKQLAALLSEYKKTSSLQEGSAASGSDIKK